MTKNDSRPYVIGAVFARGGSQGVPRKNVRLIAGKPLIAYSIETGCSIDTIDRMMVSTDDEEIAQAARAAGAEVPFMRPAELATDTAPEILSWKHLITWVRNEKGGRNPDVLVSLPATSPLRSAADVQGCIDLILAGDADAVITVTPAARNPYFNMVTMDAQGNVKIAVDGGPVFNRQSAPTMFDITTVAYAARADYVLETDSLLTGRVKAVLVPQERAMDIDSPFDFDVAEYLLKKSLGKIPP